jgi:hypothetical protein
MERGECSYPKASLCSMKLEAKEDAILISFSSLRKTT